MVFSGADPQTFEWARGVFTGLGFTPMVGGSAPAKKTDEPATPDLVPGGPLALSLIEGDMDVSVTGTVTHIDGDRIYAFGHPFYNLGPTQLPIHKAFVYSVFPSLYESWKISVPVGPAIGTIEQDRAAAVAGHLGKTPRMIPIAVKVSTSRGETRQY